MRRLFLRLRRADGYGLPEVLIVLAMTTMLASMTVLSISAALPRFRADSALITLAGQISLARELAVSSRRNVELRFIAPGTVQLWRWNGGAAALISAVVLENNMRYLLFTGIPDTPDAYGRTAAVDFATATRLQYLADGTFVDQNLVPLNGTVFAGIVGRPETARSITVLGSTGRVTSFKWTGTIWK